MARIVIGEGNWSDIRANLNSMFEELYSLGGVTTTASPTTTSGASELLTGLIGYYALNEVSGTTVTDATATQNGTTNATVNSTGKIGKCETFNGSSQAITIVDNASQRLAVATVSVSAWIYLTTLPSTLTHSSYIIRNLHSASPWECVYMYVDTDNKVYFHVKNTSSVDYEVSSSTSLSINTWYHVLGVCPGAGQALKLYINGADVSSGAESFSGTIYTSNNGWAIGDAYEGAGSGLAGLIDEVGIWSNARSSGDAVLLYGSGSGLAYPFS